MFMFFNCYNKKKLLIFNLSHDKKETNLLSLINSLNNHSVLNLFTTTIKCQQCHFFSVK